MMNERYVLAKERLGELLDENLVSAPFGQYFKSVAVFLLQLADLYEQIDGGDYFEQPIEKLAEDNKKMYEDVMAGQYDTSYANPAYACKCLGKEYGQRLSFLYTQIRSCITDVFEQKLFGLVIHMEVFLEIYASFYYAAEEGDTLPKVEDVSEILYFFVYDYMDEMTMERVREKVDPAADFAYRIIMESDLSDLRYLYRFGEYISENQLGTARYLNQVPQEQLRLMADTYTEGYRIGFVKGNKDLSKKKVVQIAYPIGFERMIKLAIENFAKLELQPVIMRTPHSIFTKRGTNIAGYYSQSPNKQYEYDHREDEALFLDKKLANRKLELQKQAHEMYKTLAGLMAGPAWVEVFGEVPFSPAVCEDALRLSEKQQQLSTWYYGQLGQLVNAYIPGDERSFTIIAFPVPEIGDRYEEIMEETIRLNTLDYQTYEDIQQVLIDALDTAEYVCIKGMNGNETDLKVMLKPLTDADKQTKFENCVADVNIPVGEVFTSPVLAGTEGLLHVSKVFLHELEYRDLRVVFSDGMTTAVSCGNFEDAAEGEKLIRENVLYHHESLPLGEFAIGTNTTAYVMGRRYQIEDRLPILIAEKTGPHFALGDTCYSHAEDVAVFNPDGKEIVARDNEVSLLRKTDMEKAYFQCHTDITIPYDELGSLYGERADGSRIMIIENGRFVLPGTEKLNEAFGAS